MRILRSLFSLFVLVFIGRDAARGFESLIELHYILEVTPCFGESASAVVQPERGKFSRGGGSSRRPGRFFRVERLSREAAEERNCVGVPRFRMVRQQRLDTR